MASELAEAIVRASAIMQTKENEQAVVDCCLTGGGGDRKCFYLVNVNSKPGYSEGKYSNYFTAMNDAKRKGFRHMQGSTAAKTLLEKANALHKENGLSPIYELFQRV